MRLKSLLSILAIVFIAGCLSYLVKEDIGINFSRDFGLKFPHSVHSGEVSCVDCHKTALKSEQAGMPSKESCAGCHDEGDHSQAENDGCYKCHDKPIKKPLRVKDDDYYADIKFNHSKHAASAEDCAKCHPKTANAASMADIELPDKDLACKICKSCHEKEISSMADSCSFCHSENRYKMKPEGHNIGWMRSHGKHVTEGVQKEWQKCSYCHQQSFCDSCHKKEAPRSHNQTWRRRTHALTAQVNRERCATCHTEGYCVRCHSSAPPYPKNATHLNLTACGYTCHQNAHWSGGQACAACHK